VAWPRQLESECVRRHSQQDGGGPRELWDGRHSGGPYRASECRYGPVSVSGETKAVFENGGGMMALPTIPRASLDLVVPDKSSDSP